MTVCFNIFFGKFKSARLAALTAFLCFSILASGQNRNFKSTTHIGVYGGMNFSSVSFTPKLKQELLPSESFGLFFRHVSEPNIGLQIEANMTRKGWRQVIDSVGTYTRRIRTYEFPVMAAFIAGKKTLRFAFTIGPYLSYREGNKETTDIIADTLNWIPHYGREIPRKFEFGFIGGLGIEVYTKLGGFAVRASYSHAISNIFPVNNNDFLFRQSRQQVIHGDIMYFISF